MTQTKQRRQLYILAALLLVAAGVWHFSFDNLPIGSPNSSNSEVYKPIKALDIGWSIDPVHATEYKSSGRDIFVRSAVPIPPDPKARKHGDGEPEPGIPTREEGPEKPILSWKFFGYGAVPAGGERQAFLLDGEQGHIVREGEIVLSHIRITRVGDERIDYEDTNTGAANFNVLEAKPTV